jgi:hypothetical protein
LLALIHPSAPNNAVATISFDIAVFMSSLQSETGRAGYP